MSRESFPEWFIDDLVSVEDKQRARENLISSRETLQFKCPEGHLFSRRVDKYISLTSMERKTECPICSKNKKRKYPKEFIGSLVDLDKVKAIDGTLTSTDRVTLKCEHGHITSSLVCSKIDLSTGKLKSCLCSVCAKESTKERHREMNKKEFPQWFIDSLLYEEDKQKARLGILCSEEPLYFKCPKGHITKDCLYNKIRVSDMTPKNSLCSICARKERSQKQVDTVKKKWVYPQWFIDELVNDSDKKKAREHTLSGIDVVLLCCPKGHYYKKRVNQRLNMDGTPNYGCDQCSRDARSIKSTPFFEYPQWFIDELVEPNDKDLAKQGKLPISKKVKIQCPVCGDVYTRYVRLELNTKTKERAKLCNKCRLEHKKSSPLENRADYPEWFIELLYDEDDKRKAREKRLRVDEIVRFKCPNGHIFTAPVSSRIKLSTGERRLEVGCKECAKKTTPLKREESMSIKRKYPDWFIDDLYLEEDKERAREKTLKTNDVVQFKCPVGHIYTQVVSGHIKVSTGERRKGCNICFYQDFRSQTELEIDQFIQSLGFSTEHTRFQNPVNPTSYFEIDIYIPEKKIGIEYNGSFFHKTSPDDTYTKDKFYHNQKYWASRQLGIHLISIFEPDWKDRKEKVKAYLKDLLLPSQQKIFARNTIVKKIESNTANQLYEQSHLLGKTTIQQVSYGLFYNSQLVSCMSFQKGRYKEGDNPVWCLTRFVTKSSLVVVGGASKLLKQFEKDFNPSVIISYSDNDYFTGNLYSSIGFKCLGDTHSPRYFWWLNDYEYKRESCQLKNLSKRYPDLFEENKDARGNKEDLIMLSLGAYKVYRSGNTKWIKREFGK